MKMERDNAEATDEQLNELWWSKVNERINKLRERLAALRKDELALIERTNALSADADKLIRDAGRPPWEATTSRRDVIQSLEAIIGAGDLTPERSYQK